jgi:hypothetical protein
MIPSNNLSFAKRNLVDGRLRVEPRSVGIILAEGLHYWGRRAVPLFNYTQALVLQLRKSTEYLSQGSRVVLRLCSLRRLDRVFGSSMTGLLSISPPRLPVRGLSQPSVGISAFQVAELRDSPHQLTLESKLSVNAVMWSAKKDGSEGWVCREQDTTDITGGAQARYLNLLGYEATSPTKCPREQLFQICEPEECQNNWPQTEIIPWSKVIVSRSAGQAILRLLLNFCRVHKSPPLNSILSQWNPLHTLQHYFLKISFNIILQPR